MIDAELLKKVKTVVTHEGCADGIASALILKDALPDAEVVFVQYNSERWKTLVNDDWRGGGWLFCDMTPPPWDADAFAADGTTIVLDHHRGARDLVAKFGERGVFADEEREPGVSGAMLAFREVWRPLRRETGPRVATAWEARWVDEFAQLAGIRDTWRRSSPRWTDACAQAAALRFWPWEDLAGLSLTGDAFASRLDIGPVLLRREAENVDRTIREAHYFKVDDLYCACFEGLHTSDVAEKLGAEQDVDLVLGWHYSAKGGPKLTVSVRSRGYLTALALAKRHGGGGHDRAAGFTLDLAVRQSEEPYVLLRKLVERALEEGLGS